MLNGLLNYSLISRFDFQKMTRIPLLLTILHFSFFGLAQQKPVSFHPSKPLAQSSIDQWTSDDGLTSNNLTSVIQATDGFLWITTYNGLLRFDGHTFTLFDRNNTSFLQSDAFYRGYVDKNKVWFTTQASGIVVYENKELKPFLSDDLPKSIRCLWISKNGDMWAGSNNNGLFLVRDSAVIKQMHEPIRDISIMSIAEDQNNNLWLATNGNGVVKINGETYEQYTTDQGLSGNVVNTIRCTKSGEVLIGTTKGFDILSPDKKITNHRMLSNVQVNSMAIDSMNSIWLATERGLARINLNLDKVELFTKDQGFPTLEVTSVAFDVEHSAWVTTSKAGLIRLKDSGITTFSEKNGLSLDLINIIVEGPDKNMYIGTDGGDIDILSNTKVKSLPLIHSHKNMSIRDICFDKAGTMWIGSYNGVLKKKNNQETLFNTTNGLPVQDVRRILEGDDQHLWFATRSGGLIKFKNDKVQLVFDKKNGLRSNYVLCVEKDLSGNIYVGTNGGGLSKIDKQNQITSFSISPDDSGLLIFNLHVDADNSVWLVTNVGVFHFNGREFKKIEFAQSTKGGSSFDWVEDNFGSVWLTTNKGILQIKKSDVLDFLNGKLQAVNAKVYNNFDGMKNKECTGATYSIKSSSGEIWVPTIGGVCVVYPDRLHKNSVVPPVYITQLTTDENTFYNTPIVIEPGNLRYTFSFTSLSLIAPSRNQFKYRLEGFDQNWIEGKYERQVAYTNLPPSKYVFRVIASNNDGVWNSTGAAMSFEVMPFFYQRTSFYISSGIAVMLLLFGIYKWRIYDMEKRNRELKKVNSELDKFVYSASHDLRAPLASVLGLVAIARLDNGKDREHHLNLIEKSILKLDGFISDIIDFSRNARLEIIKEEIHFEKLIHDVMDDLKYLDDSHNILRIVTITGQGSFYTDPRRLKIILSNLISNAFKYHALRKDNPFIEVNVEKSPRQAVIQVIDNGSGIAEQHLDSIFKMFYRGHETTKGSGLGLYIVKETVEKIEGTIEVNSATGNGSTFTVTLPSLKD